MTDQAQTQSKEAITESTQAVNFAKLRAIAETAQEENQLLKQRLSELESKVNAKPAQQEEEITSDEPYLDHNRFRKEMAKFSQTMEAKIDQRAEEKARKLIEEEKRHEYLKKNRDFNEVMDKENLMKVIEEYPEVAEEFNGLPADFQRQKALYATIKALKKNPAPEAPKSAPKSSLEQAMLERKAQNAYQPGGSSGGPFQSMGDFSEGGMKNAYNKFKSLQKTVNL